MGHKENGLQLSLILSKKFIKNVDACLILNIEYSYGMFT